MGSLVVVGNDFRALEIVWYPSILKSSTILQNSLPLTYLVMALGGSRVREGIRTHKIWDG